MVARGATAMEGAGLEHRAHLAGGDIEVAVALAADQGLAAGWSDEAEQHPQHRRLARAVRAQQADDAPWLDLEADVIDGADPTEVLGQCVNGEIEHARDSCRRRGAHRDPGLRDLNGRGAFGNEERQELKGLLGGGGVDEPPDRRARHSGMRRGRRCDAAGCGDP